MYHLVLSSLIGALAATSFMPIAFGSAEDVRHG